ncbi:MAG TPA: potassium-transporting ATPase subunit C [Acidimicrobiia bacterium]|nr:potassium-transporting ATPase subunit C [Acidimicrobiia bacterium]
MLRRQLLTGLLMTIALTLLLGIAYPLVVTGASQVLFKSRSNGSLVKANGKVIGSSLIGQNFTDANGNPIPKYFQPRPSAAGDGYDAMVSAGTNLGPSNPKLIGNIPGVAVGDDGKTITSNPFATPDDPYCVPVANADGTRSCDPNTVPERAIAYRAFNRLPSTTKVPVDAVTSSGSGLDPDISVANADLQIARVAQARNLDSATVAKVVNEHTQGRQWGFLGEKTVNVLDLNLALDRM